MIIDRTRFFLATMVFALSQLEANTDEFIPLFNGKDLSGWHKNPAKIGHGTGGRWYVEDGAIVGEQDPPGSGNGGLLLTDRRFKDFEVVFECNPDWGLYNGTVGGVCSGFFLRCTDKGQCYQIMIDYHEDGNVGEIYGEGVGAFTNRTFDLFGEYKTAGGKKELTKILAKPTTKNNRGAGGEPGFKLDDWPVIWKLRDWNEVRAVVVGNPPTIETWINGHKISKFVGAEKIAVLGDEGSFAVQVHGGNGWAEGSKTRFRNIRVKERK